MVCFSIGNIIVTIPKKMKGEIFHNLDMLTTLLGGKKEIDLRSFPHKPLIEVINKNETSNDMYMYTNSYNYV